MWCTGVLARCLLLRLRMVGVADDTAGLVWNSGLYVVDGMPATSY